MDGYQVRLPLSALKETKQNDIELKILIGVELTKLAERLYIPPVYMLPLIDDIFNKVRSETAKFREAYMGDDPYPRAACNCLSIQITPPVKGKIGIHEWNSIVVV